MFTFDTSISEPRGALQQREGRARAGRGRAGPFCAGGAACVGRGGLPHIAQHMRAGECTHMWQACTRLRTWGAWRGRGTWHAEGRPRRGPTRGGPGHSRRRPGGQHACTQHTGREKMLWVWSAQPGCEIPGDGGARTSSPRALASTHGPSRALCAHVDLLKLSWGDGRCT